MLILALGVMFGACGCVVALLARDIGQSVGAAALLLLAADFLFAGSRGRQPYLARLLPLP